jgi:hypothetical protein
MGANIAGIYGAQIFRNDDRPRYRRAFSVACAILAVGLVLAIVRYIDDRIRKRRRKAVIENTSSNDSSRIGSIVPSEDLSAPR